MKHAGYVYVTSYIATWLHDQIKWIIDIVIAINS